MTSISAPPTSSSYATSLTAQSDYRVSPVNTPPLPSSPVSNISPGATIPASAPTSVSAPANGSGSGSGSSSSRWKNVFKMGKTASLSKGNSSSSRTSVLPLDGKENTSPSSYGQVDDMGRHQPAHQYSAASSPNPSLRSHKLHSPSDPSISRATSGKSDKSGKSGKSYKSKKARVNDGQTIPVPDAARLEVKDMDVDVDPEVDDGSLPPSRPESQTHAVLTPSGDLSHSYSQPTHQSSTSGELQRPFSSVTTDTSRSSRSSGSRQLATHSPNQLTALSSASIGTSGSSAELAAGGGGSATTLMRSPGLGLTGFKSRFFSSSSAVDASNSTSKTSSKEKGKEEKYQGLGKETTVKPSRKKSVGSNGSSNHLQSPQTATSPRTPSRHRAQTGNRNTSTTHIAGQDTTEKKSGSTTPSRSAAARFLRRVVSAPNTKAFLLGNNSPESAVPPPPLPTAPVKHQTHPPASGLAQGPSPVVLVNQNASAQEVDLSLSPSSQDPPSGTASTFHPFLSPRPTNASANALSSSTGSLPYRSPAHLSPNAQSRGGISATGTRAARAHTASGATRKDLQAVVGEGQSLESHHKAVFKRTYSSNSIKTRSVSRAVSPFRPISSVRSFTSSYSVKSPPPLFLLSPRKVYQESSENGI